MSEWYGAVKQREGSAEALNLDDLLTLAPHFIEQIPGILKQGLRCHIHEILLSAVNFSLGI